MECPPEPPGGSNLILTVVTTKRRTAAPRTPARKPAAPGSPKKPPPSTSLRPSAHAGDLWAIGLITLGVLLALALWGHALGPVGHGIDTGLACVGGWTRTVIPLVCAGAGVVLLVERDGPTRSAPGWGALGLIGFCGLAELANGHPTIHESPASRMRGAGWAHWSVTPFGRDRHGRRRRALHRADHRGRTHRHRHLPGHVRPRRAVGAGAVGSTLASWWKGGGWTTRPKTADQRGARTHGPKVGSSSRSRWTTWTRGRWGTRSSRGPTDGHPGQTEQRRRTRQSRWRGHPRASGDWKLPEIYLPATKQLSHDLRQLEVAGQTLVAALGGARGGHDACWERRWGRR